MLLRRIKEGKAKESELESLKIPVAKFSVFYFSEDNSLHSKATGPLETRYHCPGPKGQVSTCVQVLKQYELGNLPEIKLLDEELSEALSNWIWCFAENILKIDVNVHHSHLHYRVECYINLVH